MATNPSFIALMNKTGIACAASDDFTIYKLSSKEPLAIAVNPKSEIPWEEIINAYIHSGKLEIRNTLYEYADDFVSFLSTIQYRNKWKLADESDSKIFFLGYGCGDVYPSSLAATFTFGDDGIESVEVNDKETVTISAKHETAILTMGDFELLAPVLYGPSRSFVNSYKALQMSALGDFKDRLLAEWGGSEEEDAVQSRFEAIEKDVDKSYKDEEGKRKEEINAGLRTFSMTDLVLSAETIINANVRLSSLFSGHRPPSECVREIAVVTRPEGLRWIKHSYIFE